MVAKRKESKQLLPDGIFDFVPAPIPERIRRGHVDNVYDRTIAAFMDSGHKSVQVILGDTTSKAAVVGLRNAINRSYKGQVRLVNRQGESYLQRL